MNPLTKEQLDALQEGASNGLCSVKGPLLSELLRGYRAYLEAIQHHESELVEALAEQYHHEIGFDAVVNYHRARLAALQAELKGE